MKSRLPSHDEAVLLDNGLLAARVLRPYYSRALSALSLRVVDGLGTAAVDYSWRLYLDPVWFAGLSPVEQATVIAAHEVEHLLRHHARLNSLAPALVANVAGDLEINDDLRQGECLPGCPLTPSSRGLPDHLLAEDYLRLLDLPQTTGTCGGGSGAGNPQSWEDAADGHGIDEAAGERLRNQVAIDVQTYAARHGRGSVPAGVLIWAEAKVAPIVYDWRRDLPLVLHAALATGRGRDDYSWAVYPRRVKAGLLTPGMARYCRKIGLAVDTSGSMDDSTLNYVASVARACGEVLVAQGDATLTGVHRGLPRKWLGGGGSDLRPLMATLVRARVDVIVVVTDADTTWPEAALTVPVVAVVTGKADAPAWCRVVRP